MIMKNPITNGHAEPIKGSVLIMAGGTGGHVFPALALAKKLKEQGFSVHWLGTQAGIESRLVPQHGFPIHYIPIHGLRGKGLLRWAAAPFKLLNAIFYSLKVLKKIKPQLVVGMGGFASGPGGIAAKILRVPLVIHEQNAIAGMTNRCLAKVADRVLCAFPGAFPASKKLIVTGNPVREEIINLAQVEHEGPLRVLVVGGSLGASVFNEIFPKALALIPKVNRPMVWHQTGEKTFSLAQEYYAKEQVEAKITAFIDNMAEAYSWADMIVCRSGAMTVSELAAAGKASILIPLPHAVDDHQRYNAKYLADKGAAELKCQSELTPTMLAELLNKYSNNRQEIQKMAAIAKSLGLPNASNAVKNACIELMNGENK
ncbi:MAG: UDP-N-acetylglucosamine--N-acetylmuramyl-(pentapeptide) pyrophosphoryl-undecaprenol [Gammaproteobacteria bacterium]|jgi:UDP-N-acetylglucosamine--N-acetylmuramyl-(pentapeptide) pyrophosphoryl-undecaprenol N-acetylglucosamine transferase|nr:UDP-N-acetylglucosamine--N-acetylmuramyl-(pentapeptide) pyrophosphoryl-undecaprenol [Gammaproteobacteria bacterium]